jgi:crossover junction endodeoxyribonuclease RusA
VPSVTVPGEPVSKERPRRGANGSWYTPTKTRAYEELVAWAWKATRIKPITSGPVRVILHFTVGGRDKDLDNMTKTVLDGLNGVAWADDRQVCHLVAFKTRINGKGSALVTVVAL